MFFFNIGKRGNQRNYANSGRNDSNQAYNTNPISFKSDETFWFNSSILDLAV